MAIYDFFRFGDDGHVKGNESRECTDDLDALDAAYDQWRDFDVEVWRGPSRVAFVTRDLRQARSASR